MATFIVKRVGFALLTILFAFVLTFVVVRMIPGNPVQVMAMRLMVEQQISYEEAYAQAVLMWGYDPEQPLVDQFKDYMKTLLRGQLGYSQVFRTTVNRVIVEALPWTVFVVSISLTTSFVLGAVLGAVIAWRRRGVLDLIVTGFASITAATPAFLFALILLILFGVYLKWFPTRGAYSVEVAPGFNLAFILNILHHAALPIMAFTLESLGGWTLAMKGSAISVLGEDFIMAARARGLPERRIVLAYTARNAILPLVTVLAISIGAMFGGSVLVETVFTYPGMGYFFSQAIALRDYGMIQGLFLITIVATVFANLLADLLYAKLDPRVKLEK